MDKGETLINCLAYVYLNPVRAGLVEKPEDYRWCSLGYHMQTNNRDGFLSLDFGLREFGLRKSTERLNIYRRFVHGKGFSEAQKIQEDETVETGAGEKFKYRSRYFTDSGIIGTKTFVAHHYQTFKHLFSSKHEKRPKTIQGMAGIYSLKRLSQAL